MLHRSWLLADGIRRPIVPEACLPCRSNTMPSVVIISRSRNSGPKTGPPWQGSVQALDILYETRRLVESCSAPIGTPFIPFAPYGLCDIRRGRSGVKPHADPQSRACSCDSAEGSADRDYLDGGVRLPEPASDPRNDSAENAVRIASDALNPADSVVAASRPGTN